MRRDPGSRGSRRSSPVLRTALIAAFSATKAASARLSSSCASAIATQFRPCSALRVKLSVGSRRIAKGTVVNAGEATSWDGLHGVFEMKRINHQEAYSLDGACPIRLRNISAAFAALRPDNITILRARSSSATRRKAHGARIIGSNGDQTYYVAGLAKRKRVSPGSTIGSGI